MSYNSFFSHKTAISEEISRGSIGVLDFINRLFDSALQEKIPLTISLSGQTPITNALIDNPDRELIQMPDLVVGNDIQPTFYVEIKTNEKKTNPEKPYNKMLIKENQLRNTLEGTGELPIFYVYLFYENSSESQRKSPKCIVGTELKNELGILGVKNFDNVIDAWLNFDDQSEDSQYIRRFWHYNPNESSFYLPSAVLFNQEELLTIMLYLNAKQSNREEAKRKGADLEEKVIEIYKKWLAKRTLIFKKFKKMKPALYYQITSVMNDALNYLNPDKIPYSEDILNGFDLIFWLKEEQECIEDFKKGKAI